MEYAEAITDIKKTATKIKGLLDKADMEKRFAAQAVHNAKSRLAQIQQEMAQLETALQQFAGETRGAAKVGPSETK